MRLIRLASLIMLIVVSLLSGTLLYGRVTAKPNELKQLGFDLCAGRPCFLGIMLGTDWTVARQILMKRKEFQGDDGEKIRLKAQDVDIYLTHDNSKQYVNGISLQLLLDSDPDISLGTAISTFGFPCKVEIHSDRRSFMDIYVEYPEVGVGSTNVSQDSTLLTVGIYPEDSGETQCGRGTFPGLSTTP